MSEPTTVTKTAPELIWLQHSDDMLDVDLPFPDEHDGISWCHEQVFMGDVEYIRKDLYAALKRQRDMLLDALKKISSPTQTENLTWWQNEARVAIAALEQRLAEAEADAQHPESVCDDCGEKNVVWSAPSELWNAVCRPAGEVGPDPMLCPHCFIERYRAANEANTQSAIDAALESIVQEIPGGSIIDPQVVCDIIRSRIGTNPLAELQATIDEQRPA